MSASIIGCWKNAIVWLRFAFLNLLRHLLRKWRRVWESWVLLYESRIYVNLEQLGEQWTIETVDWRSMVWCTLTKIKKSGSKSRWNLGRKSCHEIVATTENTWHTFSIHRMHSICFRASEVISHLDVLEVILGSTSKS